MIIPTAARKNNAANGTMAWRDRRYVCPGCGKPVKDLDAVRRRLEAKKDFITCQECDERCRSLTSSSSG